MRGRRQFVRATCLFGLLTSPALAVLPDYDHVVIVVEENHSYSQIAGSSSAPYINNTLIAEGASFTKSYGEEHHSEGNYLWLFAGSNFNIGYGDPCPVGPFSAANLASELIASGRTFGGYSEDLPSIGSTVCSSGQYWRKHNPWVNFNNIPNGTTAATSVNLRWTDWPSDFCNLRTVSIIVPNQNNDMHDGTVQMGDTWLQTNVNPYYQWAKLHNSLLILTFDEDNGGTSGLTTPPDNKIVTVFAGARIVHNTYAEGAGINHINVLRTIEDIYGLGHAGAQTAPATGAGLTNAAITDVFDANLPPLSIVRSPSSFSRSVGEGGSLANDTFTLQATGGSLNYTISDDADWLSESPASGSVNCETDTITISYSTSSLSVGSYTAAVTITAAGASNSPQTITVSLNVTPPVYSGDFDVDGDVDQSDYAHLQVCFNGPIDPLPPGCQDADLAANSHVDTSDLSAFLACFSGADLTPPMACRH